MIVKEQLVAYLDSNSLLVPEQSGYRSNHSCETVLNLVLAKWKDELDKKNNYTISIFLDLKRAFKTISRPLLLKTLNCFGIRNNEYN